MTATPQNSQPLEYGSRCQSTARGTATAQNYMNRATAGGAIDQNRVAQPPSTETHCQGHVALFCGTLPFGLRIAVAKSVEARVSDARCYWGRGPGHRVGGSLTQDRTEYPWALLAACGGKRTLGLMCAVAYRDRLLGHAPDAVCARGSDACHICGAWVYQCHV